MHYQCLKKEFLEKRTCLGLFLFPFSFFILVYHTLGPWQRDFLCACVSRVRCVCVCRHRNLYPLQLRPPFPNDTEIQKSKVGLGPDQITN